MPIYAGVEAGGTKFVCAIVSIPDQETSRGDFSGEILARTAFPTTRPEETLQRTIDFFSAQAAPIAALGVGSFGPVDPHPGAATYGYITSTPKPYWANTDLIGPLQAALGVPTGFDTDVNAAALGEHRWGAARGLDTFVYLTVGTGIGGGAYVNGRLLHGLMHPEMGHIMLPRDPQQDPFPGFCPYHGSCLEGLAAGPALEQRWQQRGETLPEDHPAWDLEAHYLALGLHAIFMMLSPERIILGGGVMQQPGLLELVRQKVLASLNGYLQIPALLENIDRVIVAPGLGQNAGVLGAIALAEQAYGVGIGD
ncbi:MAG: ROK family protein [Anaerolineales bacterium]